MGRFVIGPMKAIRTPGNQFMSTVLLERQDPNLHACQYTTANNHQDWFGNALYTIVNGIVLNTHYYIVVFFQVTAYFHLCIHISYLSNVKYLFLWRSC